MKLQNPFRVAFVATLGVGLGLLLIASVQTLSTILLYVGTALFLALGLEPMVSWLIRRRVPRWAAVLVTIVVVFLNCAASAKPERLPNATQPQDAAENFDTENSN